ncbi:MAG: ATP-grasp domain-containing protein [Oscillospiraceae bacterium]|nr:ATP-grasp domain-containing protein [Oscillospiraceae bacterium]
MQTVIVTDGKYRAAIAAVRTLGRAGYRVVVTQTRGDTKSTPPSFASKYAAETVWIEGGCDDAAYADRLADAIRKYERPVLLCVGSKTLAAVSENRGRFDILCDLLVAPTDVLDALNDKQTVHDRAAALGIPVPPEYDGTPTEYPVIVKPHCGEKFGLKAAQRYRVANDEESYHAARKALAPYDASPIVQKKIDGQGVGVSMAVGANGELLAAICHRRIREYPLTGGPSTCCESFYDEALVEKSYALLQSFGFMGVAMVEWKGEYLLEVNPRVWGSFPLTACAGSPLIVRYAEAASGIAVDYAPDDYAHVKMRFFYNDLAASLSLLLHGRRREGFAGLADMFRVKEAFADRDDPKPFRRYLVGSLRR